MDGRLSAWESITNNQIKNNMDTAHFTRVSCWIYSRQIPPLPNNVIVYYESTWDTKTNKFIKDHLDEINAALQTYPSSYCYFEMFRVPQPFTPARTTDEEEKVLQEKAQIYKDATSPFEGIISCALLQDKDHEEPTTQRIVTINIEDCTEEAIITAIRYMSRLADMLRTMLLKAPALFQTLTARCGKLI